VGRVQQEDLESWRTQVAPSFMLINGSVKLNLAAMEALNFEEEYYLPEPTDFDPPAPRLVGIELNPGPKTQIKVKKATALALIDRSKVKNRTTGKSLEVGPLTVDYIKQVCDPFQYENMASGFLTWTPTILMEPYVKFNYSMLASLEDGFVILVNPDACLAPSVSPNTGQLNNFLTLSRFVGNSLIAGSPQTAFPATNRTAVIAAISSNRISASALKVIVAHAQTATPGIITCGRLNGIISNTTLDTFTPTNFINLPGARVYTTEGGSATLQEIWLPSDGTDFEFSNVAVSNNGEGLYNPIYIAGSGFPASTRVFMDVIAHVEGQAGNLAGGAQIQLQAAAATETKPALVDEHKSVDQLMRTARPIIANVAQKTQYTAEKSNEIGSFVDGAIKEAQSVYRAAQTIGRGFNKNVMPGIRAFLKG